jgi:hypothetical protein
MPHGIDGWLWLLIDVVFVAILGAALAYGIIQSRRARARRRQQRDGATRDLNQRQR